MCESFSYCPICQLPLKAVTISPDVHVFQCMTRSDDTLNDECPQGVHCLSTDVFHYRDFTHKRLAAYRSSADFVPPDINIEPSPKKRKTPVNSASKLSPKKSTTPSKSKQKNVSKTSSSDSDSEILVQAKRPRRNLKFDEKKEHPESDAVASPTKSRPSRIASIKALSSLSSKPRTNSVSAAQKTTPLKTCDKTVNNNVAVPTLASKKMYPDEKNLDKKLTVVNVKLNEIRELTFSNSRSQSSLSSISVSTTATSKDDFSDSESDSTFRSTRKSTVTTRSKVILKEPVLKIEQIRSDVALLEFPSENLVKNPSSPDSNAESDHGTVTIDSNESTSGKFSKSDSKTETIEVSEKISKSPDHLDNGDSKSQSDDADFDDIIPVSTLDKELLKTFKPKTAASSPATTLHSCSEYNGTADSVSWVTEDFVSEESVQSDPPSSPEVAIPVKSSKKIAAFLSSSSDSDLPLASLIRNKSTLGLNSNNNEVKSKLRSGKNVQDKNNDSEIIKGKEKAGKILRNPSKTPIYINGSSLKPLSPKSDKNVNSDNKDSDSGKSTGSKDSSYAPSNRSTSSQHSDSAFSAESSNKLAASSVSSTYTSSEETFENRSSDPSFSEGSNEITISKYKVKSHNTPTRGKTKTNHYIASSLSLESESSSSEISRREKLVFGGRKKSSPKSVKHVVKINEPKKISRLGWQDSTDSDDKSEWQTLLNKMRSSCFPSDLKIDSEDSLTVASSCSSSDTSHASTMMLPRQCPFYKKIPDTPFAVDAFQYWNIPGVKIYFLSHFHSDHYIGLKKNFSHHIYCTQITANLVRLKLRVDEKWLHIMELNEPQIIRGVEVTALDANHCPGSVMFLFSLTSGRSYLHVGDFRASRSMKTYPLLQRVSISKLFLDTTYCNPQYCFPTQEEVIGKVIDIIRDHLKTRPRTLVVCGSYTIGKEKVFLGIAEAMDWHVWARPEKQRIFSCLNDDRINSRLVMDPRSANIHVLPMASIQVANLQQHLQSCTGAFSHVIGVKPTGWELSNNSQNFKVTSRDNITIYGVPYSEHSSFYELRDFVQFLQPQEVVPTVNVGNAASRAKMSKHFAEWLSPRNTHAESQTKVSQYFKKSGS